MWIIGQNHIREYPNIILNDGMLPYVDIAMEPHKVTNSAMPLDITQCPYLQVSAGNCLLPHCHPMTGDQVVTERGSFVKYAVGSNVAIFTKNQSTTIRRLMRGIPDFTM